MEDSLYQILESRFGWSQFRKGQLDILTSVMNGHDTLAVMPTGGGKSLCYQIPALAKQGIVVVISPLIALMKDQVRSLAARGIPAGCLYSGQSIEEKRIVFSALKRSAHFLLYLSPERVQKTGFAGWVRDQPIELFAIDESHCISQWGPDFRKDYHRLSLLRELRPDVPILALTATATPDVLEDIGRQLRLNDPIKHVHGFYRPNLYYQVETCDEAPQKYLLLERALRRTPTGRILIYCGTRRTCEELVNHFGNRFPEMGYYHAGLDSPTRTETQNKFETGEIRILAATNAFGMGIDHPDIRLVIHFQMPANIESYYQEVGRAGRDGAPASCLLLYSKRDRELRSYFINQSDASEESLKLRWKSLETLIQFIEGGECRHSGILTYFQDAQRIKACGHCDICEPNSMLRTPPLETRLSFLKPIGRRRKKNEEQDEGPLSREAQIRFEVLKEWRKEYALARDIPAFLVFSNKTLRNLAECDPENLTDLEDIHGFGPQKIEVLGNVVLEQLESCRE